MLIKGRVLNQFEKLEYYESMNSMFEFDLMDKLDIGFVHKSLRESFILCKTKYPYLRMKFSPNGQSILEQSIEEFEYVDLEFHTLTEEESLLPDVTLDRFNKLASQPVDLQKSVFSAKLFTYQNKNCQLFISINHACKLLNINCNKIF